MCVILFVYCIHVDKLWLVERCYGIYGGKGEESIVLPF